MLAQLRDNMQLFIVTSKNTAVATHILTVHSLRSHFEEIIGSERDGRFTRKANAVRFVMELAKLNVRTTAIVGDREHAGKSNAIYGG